MAREKIPLIITKVDGTTGDLLPVNAAQVSAIHRVTAATQAIYATESTGTPMSQPVSTDVAGRVPGYVERGPITFTITIPGGSPYTVDWDSSPATDGAIVAAWLADGAVSNVKLASGAVTDSKIAAGTITMARLALGGSGQLLLTDGAGVPAYVTPSGDVTISPTGTLSIGALKVTSAMLAAGAVTSAKLGTGAVSTAALADGAAAGAKLNLATSDTPLGAPVNIGGTNTYATVVQDTPAAGTYLVVAKVRVFNGSSTNNVTFSVKFDDDGSARGAKNLDVGQSYEFVIWEFRTVNGSTAIKAQAAKDIAVGGTIPTATAGISRLSTLRIG